MANVTDPLIKSVQGSDPQNLMEYITRQKIYDSRFWKEECFGLTAADVLERAAKSLTCVGGTFSGMGKPTKFLSLTLKLLQLQPDKSVIQTFLEQNHFKYLKVLGAFYLRLTGRPQDIYEKLDPLYADYSKLKYRDVNEWKLIHVDEFVDELLTKSICCGIAMPRLPARETLQEAGYLEEGPRVTELHDSLIEAGGLKEYLKLKVDQEVREQIEQPSDANRLSNNVGNDCYDSAISLWETRYGLLKMNKKKDDVTISSERSGTAMDTVVGLVNEGKETNLHTDIEIEVGSTTNIEDRNREGKRKRKNSADDKFVKKKKKEKKKSEKYGTLFKASAVNRSKDRSKDERSNEIQNKDKSMDENSDEYWNNLRSSLGMNALKK